MEVDLDFCRQVPKIELHAHLNGSISPKTLKELIQKKREKDPTFKTSLDIDSFVVDDLSAVRHLTKAVLQEFAEDNVRYLELRTTPRGKAQCGMDKEDYIRTILEEIETAQKQNEKMMIRLILSIDRKTSLEDALNTVELASAYKHRGIVAIDICGDPTKGNPLLLQPALEKARAGGLKITLHVGEIENYDETFQLVQLNPDRIGHGTFLDERSENYLSEKRIPLELCLTSNIVSETVKSYDAHHFLPWYRKGHPVAICTDDKGVFFL